MSQISADATSATPAAIDLEGHWYALADPRRVGEREGWFAGAVADRGASALHLPGSAQTQGIGTVPDVSTRWVGGTLNHPFYTEERYAPYRDPANFKMPFWLQPELVYVGAIWYQRTVVVGDLPNGAVLEFERVHWTSTVWIDGDRIGSERSLTTPHRYTIAALSAGEHTITVRVDNALQVDVGTNAHSVSDHTQGGWNGIIGKLTLTPRVPVRLGSIAVHADPTARSITVRGTVTADSLEGATATLVLAATPLNDGAHVVPAPMTVRILVESERFSRGRDTTAVAFDIDYPLGDDARLWDEFDPFVYELTATLDAASAFGATTDVRRTTFGLRSVVAAGTQIEVNERPTFLRGTLECCVFPLTGYPPTDVPSWARIFEVCQSYGLNHVRFHSWCPPEAAFAAADRAGVYLQIEGPVWANQGAAIGEGRDVDAYIYEESWRLVEEFGNHPSFLLMAHGNEPNGRDAEFLTTWVLHWRARDSRRLYTGASGWPAIEASDFDCIPGPRIQAWGEELNSRINSRPPETLTDYSDWVQRTPRPIVTHEAGQWCAYLSMGEIEKYTGLMKARNFEIARDFLDQAGLLERADDLLHASGRLQVLAYKEEIESALRTAGFGGIQLLGLNDFPGQGTAPVGVLDAFWDDKGYTDGAEFSRFFSSTVPLALMSGRTFSSADTFEATVKIAHFGAEPVLSDIRWNLADDMGHVLDQGVLSPGVIAVGNQDTHGVIRASLGDVDSARRVILRIAVDLGDRIAENDWEVWVYPSTPPAAITCDSPEALVTRRLDDAITALSDGAAVLFVPPADLVASPVDFGFSPVFWNVDWTGGQAPQTLGILCDPAHPAFAHFPTDAYTNWQWWEVLHGAPVLHLPPRAASTEPIVRVIDSWFEARGLALLVEARVGPGRLLLSTMDILTDLDERMVARQLNASLVSYASSPAFEPTWEITPDQLRALLQG